MVNRKVLFYIEPVQRVYKAMIRVYTQQKGAGFIEVLVALVILAIGLLGVMSMQVKGLTSNQQAVFVTEANMMAVDMAERIVAFGSTGADGGEYDDVSTTAACGAGEDALVCADRTAWTAIFDGNELSLPSASGDVAWTAPDTYTITIRWDNDRDGDAGTDCPNDSDDDLDCFQMVMRL